jgi:hypothetical protein
MQTNLNNTAMPSEPVSGENAVFQLLIRPKPALTLFLLAFLSIFLAACGGGDDVFTGDGPAGGTGNITDIQASADKVQIAADGSDFATITALVRDSSNIGVEDVPVTISVDRPEAYTVLVERKNTDASGVVTARIFSRESRAGNAIVTASVDGTDKVSNPLGFSFVGSSLTVQPASVDIAVGDQETISARVRDGSGGAAAFTAVCVDLPASLTSSALGPVFGCTQGLLTNESGEATFAVEGVAVGTDGVIRVSAVGNEVDVPVTVSARNISFVSPERDSAFAKTATVDVAVQVPGYTGDVRLSTTSGVFPNSMSIITLPAVNGAVSSPLTGFSSGRVTLLAEKLDASLERTTAVFLAFDDSELTAAETNLALQATPATLPVGAGNESLLSATATRLVGGQTNAEPVPPGTLIRFEIVGPTLGASLSSPLAFTDSAGVAAVRLRSGDIASSGDGLLLRACVESANLCQDVRSEVSITIVNRPGSISIGLANVLDTTNDDTAYVLPVSVIATDINGGALSNVDISVRIWPTRFATGVRDLDGNAIPFDAFPNEDENRNVIRDLNDGWSTGGLGSPLGFTPNISGDRTKCAAAGGGEPLGVDTFGPTDAFDNNCKLIPESTAAGSVPARISTDANGLATFNVIYLKDRAEFVEAEIRATTVVQGTQVQASRTFWLPRLEDDDNLPPSPYNTYFE